MDGIVEDRLIKEIFKIEAIEILNLYPKLRLDTHNNKFFLIGELDLIDEYDVFQDSYLIKIHPTANYPREFPLVFELDGRIPHNNDWHIHLDGHFCIKSIPEEKIICRKGINLKNFIENEIIPFLFNQTFRRLKGYFLNERPHGVLGDIETLKEKFQYDKISSIVEWLFFIYKNPEPDRVSNCFCGKIKKFRKCHRVVFREFKELKREDMLFIINRIVFSRYFFKEDMASALKIRKLLNPQDDVKSFIN